MEPNVYRLIKEMHATVSRDERNVVSSHDVAALKATLHTLLTVYAPEQPPTMDAIGEARRAPARPAKKKWYQYIIG